MKYFIVYEQYHRMQNDKHIDNDCSEEHPIHWMKRINNQNEYIRVKLLWFTQITDTEYQEFFK